MKIVHMIAFVLVIIGGLNWLVVGVTSPTWDIGSIFGGMDAVVSRIIYILVGLSAIYLAVTHKSACKDCEVSSTDSSASSSAPQA